MRTGTLTMHRLLAVPAFAAVLSLAGCGPPAREGKLAGHVPAKAVNVATVELPDVGPEAAGRRFAMRADPGRLLYVYFGFVSCPDVCPATLSDLRKALRALGPDAKRIAVAFVTVDPARDSAGALVPYVRSFVSDGHALRPADQASLGRAEAAFGAT